MPLSAAVRPSAACLPSAVCCLPSAVRLPSAVYCLASAVLSGSAAGSSVCCCQLRRRAVCWLQSVQQAACLLLSALPPAGLSVCYCLLCRRPVCLLLSVLSAGDVSRMAARRQSLCCSPAVELRDGVPPDATRYRYVLQSVVSDVSSCPAVSPFLSSCPAEPSFLLLEVQTVTLCLLKPLCAEVLRRPSGVTRATGLSLSYPGHYWRQRSRLGGAATRPASRRHKPQLTSSRSSARP